jgi:hypothetical protein
MRLRNGFSLSVGQETGPTIGGADWSATLFGLDWRIGLKITSAISVYVNNHLSFGDNAVQGFKGNFASAAMAEYELPMRLYIGAGGGFGVLNNPSGPLIAARVGYYPFKQNSLQGAVRRLNVAFDYRRYLASDAGIDLGVNQFSLTVGYDRF